MRRSKSAYLQFVCPECFHKLPECTCEHFPPWHLIYVDEKIQDCVRILNEKGYITNGSCEGHYTGKPGANTSVSFIMDYPEIIESTLPNDIIYNRRKRAILHFYSNSLGRNEFEVEKESVLLHLMDWCQALPNQNTI